MYSRLQEYVLVSQAEPLVEVYRRTEAGRWELLEGRPGDLVELRSLGINVDVAAVYANPLIRRPDRVADRERNRRRSRCSVRMCWSRAGSGRWRFS
jgi:hypothetical protein